MLLDERVRARGGQRVAIGVLDVPRDEATAGGEPPEPAVDVEQAAVDRIDEARAPRERVHHVGLEEHEARVGVVREPVDPVHARELGMRRVVEEPEPVLLGVEEVLQPRRAQRRADRVRLLGVALPGGERAERRVGRVAGRADDPMPERVGDLDLVVPVRRVDHLLQAALVAAGRDEARGVERGRICCGGDRAVGALVEREELEAPEADARQVLEDRREAARERRQRAEVGRVLGEAAARPRSR